MINTTAQISTHNAVMMNLNEINERGFRVIELLEATILSLARIQRTFQCPFIPIQTVSTVPTQPMLSGTSIDLHVPLAELILALVASGECRHPLPHLLRVQTLEDGLGNLLQAMPAGGRKGDPILITSWARQPKKIISF